MATSWNKEETLKLIELWGDDAIQAMLEGSWRSKDIFVRISQGMNEAGYNKNGEQCSSKIKKLRLEYRKIKDKRGKTGTSYKDWKYFDPLDSILGHKPATQPPVVVESSAETESLSTQEIDINHDETGNLSFVTEESDTIECSSSKELHTKAERPIAETKKKSKRKMDKIDKFDGVIEKMMKLQEQSDRNYLQLEETRIYYKNIMS